MSKMSALLDNIVRKTRALTKVPTLLKASIDTTKEDVAPRIQTTWSHSVVETAETITFEKTFMLDPLTLTPIASTPPQPVAQTSVVCYAPSHNKKAIFRKKESDTKKDQWLLEIWSEQQQTRIFDLLAINKHGPVWISGDFSSFQWSPDGSLLLYVAEKKRPLATSFFDDNAKEDAERGAESRFYADWGEQQTGQHCTVVVVVNPDTGVLTVLSPEEDVSLGQARWRSHKGVNSVVAVAWDNSPRRLGLIYCTNRASHLLELPLDGDGAGSRLTGAGPLSCRSPRVSADGSTVLWLESAVGGPHHAGARLMRRQMATGAVSVVLDLVDVPAEDGFAGLYLSQLPGDCWLSASQVCFSTPVGTQLRTLTVDVQTGVRVDHGCRDVTVLAASERLVVGVRSTLLQPPQLVAKRPGDAAFVAITETAPAVAGSVRSVVFNRPEPADLATLPYTGLLVLPPAGDSAAPLVVFPHGGPHSVMTDAWSAHVTLFCQLGLAVLLVNYRGSSGAGERSLHALPGRVGTLDVGDCAHAVQQVLATEPGLDAAKVAAYGGSHGGFLVTHLSGQYPNLIGAVAARNPVCDVAAMLEGTDIPDWNHVESGDEYDPKLVPTPERLAKMFNCSPISHVDMVRAPTMLLLGKVDRRVVPYQGMYYLQALRQRGVETELRVYDDCHPLAKPGVNGDVMVHAASWFCKKLHHTPTV